MEQSEDASNDHNLKPQQSDDEDSDFPEFEFPVGDCVDVDGARLTVRTNDAENGDGAVARVAVRPLIDESPKKMPPAIRNASEQVEPARLKVQESEPSQPEVSKHVVAEESKIPTPQIALPSQRKVLQSNPSFKSLVTILGEPLKFRSSINTDRDAGDGDAPAEKAPSTPTSKRLSGILQRVNAKVAAAAAAQTQAADPPRTPDRAAARPATSTLSVNALVEKFSTGVRTGRTEQASRRDSLASPRNLSSPRRTVAPDRSRSPVPHREPMTPSSRARPLPDRSVSPVLRSWKDSVYGDIPKDRRPNLSKPDATPPPRFLTPTRAASLKAVKPPTTPSNANSKSLQFTTAFGITTPLKPVEPASRKPKETTGRDHSTPHHVKTTPMVTEPTGFNFRTDERAERRKDFYSKLEERMKAKEMERKRAEEKAQQEKENQLRELRKSLTYKANPVPRFYQEPAPAAPEIRRVAPTRAKSPNFTVPRRRDSCPGSTVSEGHSRSSPLRSKTLLRCASLESNSGHSSSGYKPSVPKPKLPFRPV